MMPQRRKPVSPPIWPFSHSTTGTPFFARKYAVQVPMMPPPMMTTPVRAGRVSSEATGSTRGAISPALLALAPGQVARLPPGDGAAMAGAVGRALEPLGDVVDVREPLGLRRLRRGQAA